MKIHKLSVKGFRRIKDAEVNFGDATFLIGPNNTGKSTALKAISYLLSDQKTLKQDDFYAEVDSDTGETKPIESTVVLEAEFRNLPKDALEWRGFKGRVFRYDIPEESDETGLRIFYRKTYNFGQDVTIELKSLKRDRKSEYVACKKVQEFIDAGVNSENMLEIFDGVDPNKNIPAKEMDKLELIDEIWSVLDEEAWFKNPGGIVSVVLKKLPKFLFIPAEASSHEIHDTSKGILGKTLSELFETVRDASENYKEAQGYLNKLAKELDPNDGASQFGAMMKDLNSTLSSVFPDSQIHAYADLSDPNRVLRPTFNVEMSSNVKTCIENQGTGMIRSAVFGLLRYRQIWLNKKDESEGRSLIIGFEEPEIYLHPSAANQMRDAIYQLSSNNSQIVATTHSPYMIDLSRKPRQVLNRFHHEDCHSEIHSFSVSEKYIKLSDDDKQHVKMILKIDDYISRAFFTKKVVVIEGDTEDILIREAISRFPEDVRLKIKANFEVIKARGKASIISLVKYFHSLSIDTYVIHDRDKGCQKAEVFNEPIRKAVGDDNKLSLLEECVEDVLGYKPPSTDKPFKAYKNSLEWGNDWEGVPVGFRQVLERAFAPFIQKDENQKVIGGEILSIELG